MKGAGSCVPGKYGVSGSIDVQRFTEFRHRKRSGYFGIGMLWRLGPFSRPMPDREG